MRGRPWSTAAFAIMMISLSWFSLLHVEVAGEADAWAYHTSGEICSVLEGLAIEHPAVASYTTAGELLGVRNITTGLEIPILLVGEFDEMRPSSLLIGGHHGDEPDSSESVLGFATYLLDGYASGDRTATHIVENTNTAILPVVNPWGLDSGIRYDENGEDPNRDYPFDPSPSGFYSDGVPLTTAGASAVHEICRMYPFQISLSFHTGSFGIYMPWGANDVGNLTPDLVSFNDMGYAISKASGWSIPYGPANDFPYVGYLTGAYDDHVYGASFLGDHLYDEEMILPWSTHTATVELVASKGKDVARLGNLDGVLDPGGEDDGTVPAGIRICLAACELVSPHFMADVTRANETISVELELIGSVDPGRPSLFIEYPDGSMESLAIDQLGADEIFPRTSYSFSVDIPKDNGTLTMEVTAEPDRRWGEYIEGGYPEISPRSLLSLSRGTNGRFSTISWSEVFLVENPVEIEPEPEPEPEPIHDKGTYDLGPDDLGVIRAGDAIEIFLLMVPGDNETIESGEVIVEGVDFLFTGTLSDLNIGPGHTDHTYRMMLPSPTISGNGSIRVFIHTNHWNYTVMTEFNVIPHLEMIDFPEVVNPISNNSVQFSIKGVGTLPVTLAYGLSISADVPWYTEENWIYGPVYYQIDVDGTFRVDLPIPAISGDLYLRATTIEGYLHVQQRITVTKAARATDIPVRVKGDVILFGPAMIHYIDDGILEGSANALPIDYIVKTFDNKGDQCGYVVMDWRDLSSMNEEDLLIMSELAEWWGIDIENITGGWMGSMNRENTKGAYFLQGRIIIGDGLIIAPGQDFNEDRPSVLSGSYILEKKDDEDKTGSTIAWVFLLVTIAIAFGLLIVKLRNEARSRREEVEEPFPERRVRRAAAPHPPGRDRHHGGDVGRNPSGMKFK